MWLVGAQVSPTGGTWTVIFFKILFVKIETVMIVGWLVFNDEFSPILHKKVGEAVRNVLGLGLKCTAWKGDLCRHEPPLVSAPCTAAWNACHDHSRPPPLNFNSHFTVELNIQFNW